MPRQAGPRPRKSSSPDKAPPVPHHVRRRQTEDAVLESAERLFVTNGFHRTTVDDIAKDAGLTKGAVYFHFRDKIDVLMALLHRAEDRVLYPILNRMRNNDVSPTDRIVEYLHSWARVALEQRNTMFLPILMSFEFLGTNDPIEREIRGMYDRIYATLHDLIAQGRASGELNDTGPIDAHVAVLVAITDGMLLEWLRHSDKFDGSLVTSALRHVMLAGLTSGKGAAARSAEKRPAAAAKPSSKTGGA